MLIVVALIIQATDVIHNVPAGIYGFHAVAMVSLNVRVSVLSSSFLLFNSSKAFGVALTANTVEPIIPDIPIPVNI